jgi:hypothetical protein
MDVCEGEFLNSGECADTAGCFACGDNAGNAVCMAHIKEPCFLAGTLLDESDGKSPCPDDLVAACDAATVTKMDACEQDYLNNGNDGVDAVCDAGKGCYACASDDDPSVEVCMAKVRNAM